MVVVEEDVTVRASECVWVLALLGVPVWELGMKGESSLLEPYCLGAGAPMGVEALTRLLLYEQS